MDRVYILNREYGIEGVIDEYVSTIWRPSYSEVGDCELYLQANGTPNNLLEVNKYLVRSSDITVDSDDKVTFRKVMIIKNIQYTTSEEVGDFITVTGYELKYLLHQRIVWTQTNLTGTAEDAIRRLVNENAINPTDSKRIIPNLTLGSSARLSDTIDKQITGDSLDSAIVDICKTYNYGWEIYIYDGQLILNVYNGLDRSYGQSERPYVVFSPDFENLYNTDYQLITENYANCTLIGGEGEGSQRVYRTLGTSNSGLDRFEVFTDARDLSSNKGSADEIPMSTYYKLLEARGAEYLADLALTEGFSGEVLPNIAFKYGVDYDLGDIVTVISEYGIKKNVRVLSAIESEDVTGSKLLPQFNM